MRSTILFFTFFLGCISKGMTQVSTDERMNRHTLFGFKIGATYTCMNFNKGYPAPVSPVSSSWKAGLTAGAVLNVRLTDKLSLQPEYLVLTASSTRNDSAIAYRMTYLSFPALLKYNFFSEFYILGGAQFDLLLSARRKTIATSDITHDTEERNVGVTGGLEYIIRRLYSLSLRYTHGLNHIGIGQRSNLQEYKSQQVVLTAGFYF